MLREPVLDGLGWYASASMVPGQVIGCPAAAHVAERTCCVHAEADHDGVDHQLRRLTTVLTTGRIGSARRLGDRANRGPARS